MDPASLLLILMMVFQPGLFFSLIVVLGILMGVYVLGFFGFQVLVKIDGALEKITNKMFPKLMPYVDKYNRRADLLKSKPVDEVDRRDRGPKLPG